LADRSSINPELGDVMSVTSLSERLAGNGLQQHLHAEATAVEEGCIPRYESCAWDSQCCHGLICEWFHCYLQG
jgi:hypothetical protein